MKNPAIAALLASSLLAIPLASGDDPPIATPEKVGISGYRLAAIDEFVNRHLEANHFAGAVTLVSRRGKLVQYKAYGLQDVEFGVPMSKDSMFRIYSMTKPITSVAVMMLFEEGRFLLDDPVSRYLPEFKELEVAVDEVDETTGETALTTVAPQREVSIRDLLRHTSGLTYGVWGTSAVDKMYLDRKILSGDATLQNMVEKLAEIPLKHQPGSVWEYSVSTDVLGRLVEVISGTPFDRFLDARIFTPLGMEDTGFFVPAEKVHRLTTVYTPNYDNTAISRYESSRTRDYSRAPTFFSGGGGLVSTASDYFRFAQMLLNRGELDGVRILGPETIELMTCNHLDPAWGRGDLDWYGIGLGFGLGFWVAPDRGVTGLAVSEGSFGWGGMAQTTFWVDPREELVGIFLIQILPESPLPYRELFKPVVYQAIVD
jgi:CubicO group peptidase (beta-lactamase class C family)